MTNVRVGLKYLQNLGDFENIQVSVEISDDIRPGESAPETVDRVYRLVEAKLIEKAHQAYSELKN